MFGPVHAQPDPELAIEFGSVHAQLNPEPAIGFKHAWLLDRSNSPVQNALVHAVVTSRAEGGRSEVRRELHF